MYWYRPILALHVIAIISWMAGILYLYRLLIYSSEHGCKPGETNELLKTMSRRLLKAITIPAMVVSWLAGISMVSLNPFLMSQTWFIVKFIGVLGITASTMHAAKQVRLYQNDQTILGSKALRFLNEVPTLFMIFYL